MTVDPTAPPFGGAAGRGHAPTVDRAASPKLAIEHVLEGDVACLRFAGTIDEQFAGAITGASIAAGTDALVLDLGGVRKISSFGIREWVDFMTAARDHAKEVLLVECAPKVVDQLNMVANFASGARVYSLYAPFRCDFCDSEHRALLQVDRDADAIKAMALPERPCPSCKQPMYFDDDGATFFSYVAAQPRVELAPAVAAFLGSRFDYALADGTRKLRVDKVVDGRATFLRLAGDLDRAFPTGKLAEGLEGEVFVDVAGIARIDPAGAAEWRGFVQLVTPVIERMWIAGASAAFRDKLATPGDLGPRGAVLDPATTTPELATRLAGLRAKAAASRPSAAKLALAPSAPAPAPPPAPPLIAPLPEAKRTSLWTQFAIALLALALVGVGIAIYVVLARAPEPSRVGSIVAVSTTPRPAWLTDASGCSASSGGGLVCVGVSAHRGQQDEAEDEAADAAYDALAAALAVRISDKAWRAQVVPVFTATRDAKLAAFDRDPSNTVARRDVLEARHAVAQILRASGGAVPAAPSARYWERRVAGDDSKIYIASAELVVAAPDLQRLADAATHADSALGVTAVRVAPGVGWRYPHVERGAIVTALAPGPLQELGLTEGTIVLAIDGRDVSDAAAFAKLVTDEQAAVSEHGGTLRLKIAAGDGGPHELVREYPVPDAPIAPSVGPAVHAVPTGGINVWDRYGGSRGAK